MSEIASVPLERVEDSSCVQSVIASFTAAPAMVVKGTQSLPERDTFEREVRPHVDRVYRYCYGLTGDRDVASDVFQESLVLAWKRFDTWEGRADFGAWLCGIARHQYLETRRTEARRRGLFERVVDAWRALTADAPGDAALQRAIEHEELDALVECLQSLPEEFRSVVLLCDVEELPYDTVAEALGVPIGTVKSRHTRGRRKLREALAARGREIPGETAKVNP